MHISMCTFLMHIQCAHLCTGVLFVNIDDTNFKNYIFLFPSRKADKIGQDDMNVIQQVPLLAHSQQIFS